MMWFPAAAALLATGWQHSPLSASPSVTAPTLRMQLWDRVKQINEANKMPRVARTAPKVRGRRLPADILAVTQKFKKEYTRPELETLWGALLACYGSEALARQAVLDNPQIINPSYSFCNTMLASKDVLFGMMGKEEALDVMSKNPAVLQCGPSLDTLGPDEIKGFANIRSLGNKIPEQVRGFILAVTIGVCVFPVIATQWGFADNAAVSVAKPLVGTLFAVAIEGSRIVIVGTIAKAKLAGDERIKAAEAATARRMGKATARRIG